MEDVFKALADPSRRKLLDRLYRRDGQTLGELCARVAMTRFGVMKHLRLLERAGLVVTRREGREKLHYLNPMPIRLAHDRWVSKYRAPFAAALALGPQDAAGDRRAAADAGGGGVIRALSADEVSAKAGLLAEVLLDAVAGGASVSFMADFSRDDALAYWQRIANDVREGRRVVFAAGDIDGTAQLVLDTPPNQPHRADLAKMLVHRRARRRGLGRALFEAVEAEARRRGRTLITFDTMSGSDAERLYLSCGCAKVGEIPGYALWPTGGVPGATSVFYKALG